MNFMRFCVHMNALRQRLYAALMLSLCTHVLMACMHAFIAVIAIAKKIVLRDCLISPLQSLAQVR